MVEPGASAEAKEDAKRLAPFRGTQSIVKPLEVLAQDDDKYVRDLGKDELDIVNKLINSETIVPKFDK